MSEIKPQDTQEQQPVEQSTSKRPTRKVMRHLTAMALQGAFDNGRVKGYNAGIADGYRTGERNGYAMGNLKGYEDGRAYGLRSTKVLWATIGAVFGFALCAAMFSVM